MAVGILKKWKYPLGYYFSSTVMTAATIEDVVKTSISVMDAKGFNILGVTADKGSNFEKAFKALGATTECPSFEYKKKTVCRPWFYHPS